MPLTVNVGLSQKSSENFQSTGVSINLTAELDQSLLANPPELQAQVARLYQQAEEAVARQMGGSAQAPTPQNARPNGHGNGHGNGSYPGRFNGGPGRMNGRRLQTGAPPATASQVRAIRAIADNLGVDPDAAADEHVGAPLARLTVPQASVLIDALKARQGSAAGQGR